MARLPSQEAWELYREKELSELSPLLRNMGFSLDTEQPHIKGERFLMQAVTTESGKKLILLGKRMSDGLPVVIKATSDAAGRRELKKDRQRRLFIHKIRFAYDVFFTPDEVLFTERAGFVISMQKFIEQEKTFLERPLKEQFALALTAFKAQEGAHATTYGHARLARRYFSAVGVREYLKSFDDFKKNTLAHHSDDASLKTTLEKAHRFLTKNAEVIEQYSGFLTHTDFVPHNIRVADGRIYLLDHSSLRFGNKYEGWARFLNFMALYNPELEAALTQYVKDNRTAEESLSLRLMRVYRLVEIIWFYTRTLNQVSGDLKTLNKKRAEFWTNVLKTIFEDKQISKEVVEEYKKIRDTLRSDEGKRRQVGLH